MKSLFIKSILFFFVFSMISCADESRPNYQYMPDMYEEVSYEPYGSYEVFANEQEAKLPVEGTISRGWKPFPYENSNEGYENAKSELENPLPYTQENIAQGQQLYTIYCAVCHGDEGDGKGILVEREKFLGVPPYDTRELTQGSIYYVMYYGRNAMGSYASQTSIKERWQIAHYVSKLNDALKGNPEREFETVLPGSDGDTTSTENLIPAINADKQMISKENSTTGPGEGANIKEE